MKLASVYTHQNFKSNYETGDEQCIKTEKVLTPGVANTEKELTKAGISPTKPIWIKILLLRQETWRDLGCSHIYTLVKQ